MKKIIGLSLVAATLLFTGCGEDSKKAASEATAKAVEGTKAAANSAVDATKEAADKAVEAAKEATEKAVEATKVAAEATKEAAAKAVDSTEKAVNKAVAAVVDTTGKDAYAKCAGCHGLDGKTKALGKSPIISGQSKEDLVSKMKGYKAGTRNEAGMGSLMKGQVASMDDATIDAVSAYISTLK